MTISVAIGSRTLGCSVPPSTEHAVITSLPEWRDNVALVVREPRVSEVVTAGYPRFYLHKSIERLANICEQKFATNGYHCALYPSKRAAEECRKFMLSRSPRSGTPGSVKLLQYSVCPEDSSSQLAELHIVVYPADMRPSFVEFWQYTGLGISSRFAEYCLFFLPGEDRQEPSLPRGLIQPSSDIVPSDPMNEHRGVCMEDEHAHVNAGAFAKHVIRRRIARLLVSGDMEDATQPCTPDSLTESRGGDPQVVVREDDVYLFSCGMAAIWNAHQLCMRARPPAKSVSFGFLNLDTLRVLQAWGAGILYFGNGPDSDIDALENFLVEEYDRDPTKPPILAIFTELPSNPLLDSPDLPRFRALADTYDFLLVIDDTVASSVDVEVLPYADIVVTSLTKVFSGAANVMGGSLVLNSRGRHYATLKEHLAIIYEDTYFEADVLVMERNSRDLVQRVRIIDENAEALCAFLRSRSVAEGGPSAVIKEIYYPKYRMSANYLHCKRAEGGYGGLISLTFTSLAASIAFYEALPCYRGPSLGTNFTLACAYTVLALHRELEWAAQYGIEEGLVRISVGMEDREWLIQSFEIALQAAASA